MLLHLRHATRRLIRSPGFSVVALGIFTLAIGATTAIFSLIYGVLLKPLPYKEPDRLVRIASAERDGKPFPISVLDYIDYRDQSHDFEAMAPYDIANQNLVTAGMDPLRLNVGRVGARFFSILGVSAQLGRTFADGEDAMGGPKIVVLSDALWRTRFGADPHIVGQTVSLDAEPYTVVGVAPPKFQYPAKPDLWAPLQFVREDLDPRARGGHAFVAIGRVKPGVPIASASHELAAIAKVLEQRYPETNIGFSAMAQPLQEQVTGRVKPALYALLGSVVFVLLIACANVANLFLVRAAARQHDVAVRTALGASQRHVMAELLTESVLLSAAGAVLGALLATWLVQSVVTFGPRGLPRLDEVTVDGRVLLFTAVVAAVTGVLVGLAPAWHAARPDISQMLRDSGRSVSRGAAHRTRALLVVIEMALAVVLLIGAGLLLRSFVALAHVDPGFRAEHVTTFNVTLPDAKFPLDREKTGFVTALIERLQRLPGTEAAAATSSRPMSRGVIRTSFEIAGRPRNAPDKRTITDAHTATADYFRAMGVPLLRGRAFTPADDRMDANPVLIVTAEFARRYFPGAEALGQSLTLGIRHDTAQAGTMVETKGEIVGIVGDTKQSDLAEAAFPGVYIPASKLPLNDISVVVRGSAAPSLLAPAIKRELREIDPNTPMFALQSMEQAVGESVAQPRFYTVLLGAFAAVALILAAVGVYGVISYGVSLRSRELGIRVALGATGDRVVRLVLRQGIALTVSGVAAGLLISVVLTRAVSTMLFGVAALDPATYVAVPAVLLAVALLASYLPARRAARIDPAMTMRAE